MKFQEDDKVRVTNQSHELYNKVVTIRKVGLKFYYIKEYEIILTDKDVEKWA